jgi:starvation-inducible outer membrane lipoprotein
MNEVMPHPAGTVRLHQATAPAVRGAVGAALVLLLTGCSGIASPFGSVGLDAKQLEALAKVKDANVLCIEADVMLGGVGSLVFASVDKGIRATISVDARGKCAIRLTTGQ